MNSLMYKIKLRYETKIDLYVVCISKIYFILFLHEIYFQSRAHVKKLNLISKN